MILHLTKKLADKLKLSPFVEADIDEFFSWRANFIHEDGLRFVVIMNDASRFTIVINEAKADKLKKLPELFLKTLRETLLSIGVNHEVVARYIEESGEIKYSKNSDKKKTAQLNKNVINAWWAMRDLSDDVEISLYVSSMIYNITGLDEVVVPMEKMLKMLSKYGLPVRKCRAFDLNVRLDLDGRDAVRRLRVPADSSFVPLHKLMQKAFGWLDYHLYSFEMFEEWSDDYYAIADVELVMSEEDLDVNPDTVAMKGLKLSDYIPKYRKILYKYDFGDDWHHYIEVESIIEECDEDLPLLISGIGDTPPEDVGGPRGFEDFLRIINDSSHEEYKETIKWANSQRWKPFDFDTVARRVNENYGYISSTTKSKTVVPDETIEETILKPIDTARNILDYMEKNPDRWGTVIAPEPQWICDNCGFPAKVIVDDNHAKEIGKLCVNCYNRLMAEYTGSSIPDIVPTQISVKGRNGKPVEFEVEFLVFANGMSLTAIEMGKRKRRADVYGAIGEDFNNMLETLKNRIKKVLSVKYMGKDGYISGAKAVGYIGYNCERDACDIVIDGMPYSWAELEMNVTAHEGWKIKIEFASTGDELD